MDTGRYDGIKQLGESPFNLLGPFNDGDPGQNAISTAQVRLNHRNRGEFRVPALRGIASTAPYMHNGSLATLRSVVKHYSELDIERLHNEGERLLRPLKLDDDQIDDLVFFLGINQQQLKNNSLCKRRLT